MASSFLAPIQLKLSGKDALDLLHRISTLNIQSLSLNTPTFGLFLNAQGKIEAAFTVSKVSATEVLIEAYDEKFQEILDRYTFAEKYTLEKLSGSLVQDSTSEYERVIQMKPKLGNEYFSDGNTNPLEVNLKPAIHDQKGCYPGQEVIEKIIALGSPAKRLCLLSAEVSLQETVVPTPLLDPKGVDAGTLTSVYSGHEGNFALAIVKRTHAKENQELITQTGQRLMIRKVST